jgi:hypothetical protein
MDQNDSITVTIRSYISPDEPVDGYRFGESFRMDLPCGITMRDLMGRIFSKKSAQIGVMAVNGTLASEETILMQGDSIDLFPLLEGG